MDMSDNWSLLINTFGDALWQGSDATAMRRAINANIAQAKLEDAQMRPEDVREAILAAMGLLVARAKEDGLDSEPQTLLTASQRTCLHAIRAAFDPVLNEDIALAFDISDLSREENERSQLLSAAKALMFIYAHTAHDIGVGDEALFEHEHDEDELGGHESEPPIRMWSSFAYSLPSDN